MVAVFCCQLARCPFAFQHVFSRFCNNVRDSSFDVEFGCLQQYKKRQSVQFGSSGFEQDMWVALRSGTALENCPAELESHDFAAGRPAGRNLESEMALASVGEPDAAPANALPLMPLAEDEFEEDAGVLDPARCCLARPVWAGRNSPNP